MKSMIEFLLSVSVFMIIFGRLDLANYLVVLGMCKEMVVKDWL